MKLRMESVTGEIIFLSVTEFEINLFGEKRKLKALCYAHAPVDVLLGRNYQNIKKNLVQAEGLVRYSS